MPISPSKPGSGVLQPNQCSTAISIKQLRTINGPSDVLVSMAKGRVKEMCHQMFPKKINQSSNQTNFYSANIPGEARLSGATDKSVFISKIEETVHGITVGESCSVSSTWPSILQDIGHSIRTNVARKGQQQTVLFPCPETCWYIAIRSGKFLHYIGEANIKVCSTRVAWRHLRCPVWQGKGSSSAAAAVTEHYLYRPVLQTILQTHRTSHSERQMCQGVKDFCQILPEEPRLPVLVPKGEGRGELSKLPLTHILL